MAIIISENGKNAKRVESSNFALEDKLQQYIYDNPDAIPLYDIDQDTRLFIAAREFKTNSGPIDALGFDASGNIYVVETKLYKNPDKRTVVAQALDYGASLWRHAIDFDEFISQLDTHTQKQFNQSFKEQYAEFFGIEDPTENLDQIKINLSDGSIKFVVLMDNLHDALKDLVIFVNRNSKFDLYAVELEYYKHNSFEIIIPKLFGAEVKKELATRARSSQSTFIPATIDEFWTSLVDHYHEDIFSDNAYKAVKILVEKCIELTEAAGGRNTYWRATTKFRDVVKVLINDSDDKVVMYIDSDSSIGVYSDKTGPLADYVHELLRRMVAANILKRTDKHAKGTQWFTNLKKSYASDDEVQKFISINNSLSTEMIKDWQAKE